MRTVPLYIGQRPVPAPAPVPVPARPAPVPVPVTGPGPGTGTGHRCRYRDTGPVPTGQQAAVGQSSSSKLAYVVAGRDGRSRHHQSANGGCGGQRGGANASRAAGLRCVGRRRRRLCSCRAHWRRRARSSISLHWGAGHSGGGLPANEKEVLYCRHAESATLAVASLLTAAEHRRGCRWRNLALLVFGGAPQAWM